MLLMLPPDIRAAARAPHGDFRWRPAQNTPCRHAHSYSADHDFAACRQRRDTPLSPWMSAELARLHYCCFHRCDAAHDAESLILRIMPPMRF